MDSIKEEFDSAFLASFIYRSSLLYLFWFVENHEKGTLGSISVSVDVWVCSRGAFFFFFSLAYNRVLIFQAIVLYLYWCVGFSKEK